MSKRSDRARKSRTTTPYRTVEAVADWQTRVPAVEGPVLIVSNAVGKGLWYLSLSLIHLLRRRGLEVSHASFQKPRPERCEGWAEAPVTVLASERAFLRAARRHRTLITLEGRWWDYPKAVPGCRRIDVPNYDCIPRSALSPRRFRHLDEVWATVEVLESALRAAGIGNVRRVRWDFAGDPVFHPPRRPRAGDLPTFYFPRADGGVGERKGTEAVLEAFARARRRLPMRLIFSSTEPFASRQLPAGVELHEGRVPRIRIADWYREADWVLYPSRREGLGLTFFEAGRCGAPVITTDAPPMNEPGLSPKILVPVARTEAHPETLAPIAHVAPEDLAEVMVRVAKEKNVARGRQKRGPKPAAGGRQTAGKGSARRARAPERRYSTMVLITSYGRPRLLQRAVESVLATTPEDCFVLVIDDASPPAALAWIRRQSQRVERLELLVKKKRAGLADSMNLGLARAAKVLAPESLLYYLQDDTEAEPGWHEALGHLWHGYREPLGLGFVSGHLAPEHFYKTRDEVGRERPRLLGIERTAHGDVVLLASIRATNMVADLETWRSHGKIPNRMRFPTPTRRGRGRGLGSNVDWFLLRDGPKAMIRRGQRCGVLPGYVLHQGEAARDSTWNNPSPEFTAVELARFERYRPGSAEPAADRDVPLELKHFRRIVHLSAGRRADGHPGGVAKFGHYLRGAVGCELVTGDDLARGDGGVDLDDPHTLYVVDNHWGLKLGESACCVTMLQGCAAERGFNPKVGAEQQRMAKRPRQYTIANSGETALLCREVYGSRVDEILPLAVDESRYWPPEPAGELPLVLMAAKSRHKGAGLVEPLRRELEGRFELELLDCPVGEEPAAFRRAQIFVNLSTHEGFCYALLEALAADCTALTTAHGLGYDLAGSGVVTVIDEADARDARRVARRIEEAWRRRRPGVARRWVEEHGSLGRFERRFRAAVSRADRYFGALCQAPAEAEAAPSYRNWADPRLPARQRRIVERQLRRLAKGAPPAVFSVAVEAVAGVRDGCESLLDAGCSSGYYHQVLRDLGLAYRGCDLSLPMLALARRRHPQAAFELQDAVALGYGDASFDVVFSGSMLSHCQDYERVFAELARVARRYLILHRCCLAPKEAVVEEVQLIYDVAPVPRIRLPRRRLAAMAQSAGFEPRAEYPLEGGQATFVFARRAVGVEPARVDGEESAPPATHRRRAAAAASTASTASTVPAASEGGGLLVSCIMPTYDRRPFVARAIRYFLRQDHPERELVVVDDGTDPVADLMPGDPRIRYLRLDRRLSVGAKRNLACREARGEVLLHWDDDDWHAPWRVSYQLRELRRRRAELCGLDRIHFYDPRADRAWQYVYPSGRRPWLYGGTLCYTRAYWQDRQFPEINVGEDNRFVRAAGSSRVAALADGDFYVGLIHPRNTSRKRTAGRRWRPASGQKIRTLLGADHAFYAQKSQGPPAGRTAKPQPRRARVAKPEPRRTRAPKAASRPARAAADPPLVSCIMATCDRRPFVPDALRYFLRQDYPRLELLILDDGSDKVADLVPDDPRIRYLRLDGRLSLGAKRNRGCEAARGEIVAYWDDDDWYAPHRVSYQAAPLLAGQADLTVLGDTLFYSYPRRRFWACSPKLHDRMFYRGMVGGTQVFWKKLWRRGQQYPARSLAEEIEFVKRVSRRGARVEKLANPGVFVYGRHEANSWQFATGRHLDRGAWRRVERPDFLPAGDLDAAAEVDPRRGVARRASGGPAPSSSAGRPLVSCVMATGDRRAFLRQAIKYFQRQTWEPRELILVDDGERSSADLVPADDRIRYLRLPSPTNLGRKLNLGVEQAGGSIIQKLDDDDYYRPDFLAATVAALLPHAPASAIVGLDCFLVLLAGTGELKFSGRGYCAGASLCFSRRLWQRVPFRDVARSVDHYFLQDHEVRRVKVTDPELLIVVRHHRGHLWRKLGKLGVEDYFRRRASYPRSLAECVPAEDLNFYRRLRRISSSTEAREARLVHTLEGKGWRR